MLHEISFKSYNQRDDIQAWIYVPAETPKGIVQLVHGFGEHSRRYLHMIAAFVEAGYIVAADDHTGHGKTAVVNGVWGDWGDKGYAVMREDEHTLHRLTREKYPDLPYFFYGHSMGSFITRDYIAHYGEGLAGATLCGTCGDFRGANEVAVQLDQAIAEGRRAESDPAYGAALMGWMCERCGVVSLGNEWINHSASAQKDHAEDPFDAFTRPTSNRSMRYFIEMMQVITGKAWAEKVPRSLPIYNIAGDQDPVGNYGEGVCQTSNWLVSTGHNVTMKLYAGYRHEIHNYSEIKSEVEQGIIDFMDAHLS